MRTVILAAAVLGVCEIVVGVLTHRGHAVSGPAETAPSAAAAEATREFRRRDALAPREGDDGRWRPHLDIVEQELARGRVDVAVRAWHDAHGAALASRSWEGMIALGDAWMAIARAAGTPRGGRERAREAYTTALVRARRVRSVEGVIGSAEGFRRLDEHLFAEQSLRIAEQVAEGDGVALQRVREVRQRWAASETITEF